jgi:hypothetical protein
LPPKPAEAPPSPTTDQAPNGTRSSLGGKNPLQTEALCEKNAQETGNEQSEFPVSCAPFLTFLCIKSKIVIQSKSGISKKV